jgi:Zn-dependent peptidase ImmA (M78 family)
MKMAIDEFTAVLRAREFVRKVNPTSIPVAVERYADEISAVIRPQADLEANEAGYSFESNGKYFICVNANDSLERQRFTICHEIAHIKLKLPSQHHALPWWSYAKRPLAEILCDVFAAELLLPYDLFKPKAEKSMVSLAAVEILSNRFEASLTATGSRFAAVISTPVAFVLSEQGKVRYASRSTPLKEAGAWIAPRLDLPEGSLSKKLRAGTPSDGPERIDADIWFSDWERGGTLLEEVRQVEQWDQTLTLLWFENEQIPPRKIRNERGQVEAQEEDLEGDDGLLKELDGHLRWPGKRRRR